PKARIRKRPLGRLAPPDILKMAQFTYQAPTSDSRPVFNLLGRQLPFQAPFDEISRIVNPAGDRKLNRSPGPAVDFHQDRLAACKVPLELDHRYPLKASLSYQPPTEFQNPQTEGH